MNKNFISLADFSEEELLEILALAEKLKQRPLAKKGIFKGKSLGLIFQKDWLKGILAWLTFYKGKRYARLLRSS